jgi:hypothetical protein
VEERERERQSDVGCAAERGGERRAERESVERGEWKNENQWRKKKGLIG